MSRIKSAIAHIICFGKIRLCSIQEEVIVRSHPDSQCVSHRRSYRSAAGQIWETSFWLEITFFSFSAPRLSSFRLPPLPRSPCLLCLLPQIDRDSWGTEPSKPSGQHVFTKTCRPAYGKHAHTHKHTCIASVTASLQGWSRDTIQHM